MPINVIMPQLGESITEGTLTKWLKKEGDRVKRDEDIFEISTDKVDSPIQSPAAGILTKILVQVGAKVPINTVVAILEEASGEEAVATAAVPAAALTPVADSGNADGRIFSSPLVRRIAQEEGVDLAQIQGSGWKGRITKKDIMDHIEAKKADPTGGEAPAAVSEPAVPVAPLPPQLPPGPGRKDAVAMTPMRAKIAEHMTASLRTSAHVTTVFEVDVTEIVAIRDREKEDFQKVYGARLTFTPFFAMACVEATKDFQIINASVDGDKIVYRRGFRALLLKLTQSSSRQLQNA